MFYSQQCSVIYANRALVVAHYRRVDRQGYWRRHGLLDDLHAAPKRNASLNMFSRRLGLRIVPGRIGVACTLNIEMIVVRGAFPMTVRLGRARLQIATHKRLGGEIVVAFNNHGIIAFGEKGLHPDGFHAVALPSGLAIEHHGTQSQQTRLELLARLGLGSTTELPDLFCRNS